ncbi:hypothetical protein J3R74_002158 [Puniceicoccus vermicola]
MLPQEMNAHYAPMVLGKFHAVAIFLNDIASAEFMA